jgi:hypothetical protein
MIIKASKYSYQRVKFISTTSVCCKNATRAEVVFFFYASYNAIIKRKKIVFHNNPVLPTLKQSEGKEL